jgi:hypothetical protein
MWNRGTDELAPMLRLLSRMEKTQTAACLVSKMHACDLMTTRALETQPDAEWFSIR